MDYQIIRDEKGIEKILFKEPKFIGLQELLNTIDLYCIDLSDILDKLNIIKSGESEAEEIGTERVMVEITPTEVQVYDMFEGIIDDEETFEAIKISLEEFENVISLWNEREENRLKD